MFGSPHKLLLSREGKKKKKKKKSYRSACRKNKTLVFIHPWTPPSGNRRLRATCIICTVVLRSRHNNLDTAHRLMLTAIKNN